MDNVTMKRSAFIFFLFLFFLTPPLHASHPLKVSGYKSVFRPFRDSSGSLKIALREFSLDKKTKFLTVDPFTFLTAVTDSSAAEGMMPSTFHDATGDLKDSPFMKALGKHTTAGSSGIKRSERPADGVFLTIDLCPSKKKLDKEMFVATEKLSSPAPVAIAISGAWITRHGKELKWIKEEEKAGRLDVTWINHGYTHRVSAAIEPEKNFLLLPGTDFEKEVLLNEILLLENGITPSAFFRFPGLISNGPLMESLRTLSLIPVGANAWLAKGEEAKNGGIILVHGNGNEEAGIKRLLAFYNKKADDFKNKRMKLLPLKDAFAGE